MMNRANETVARVADRAQHSAATVADRMRENPIPLATLAAAGVAWWMSRDRHRWAHAAHRGAESMRPGDLASAISDHPVQSVLLAGTVGSLLVGPRRGNGHAVRPFSRSRAIEDLSGHAAGLARHATATAADYVDEAQDAVEHRASHLRETVREYGDHARETFGGYVRGAKDSAAHATGRLKEKARHVANGAQQRWEDTTPAVERWCHDNPLAVGAAALAVGTAVGLSLPRTRTENLALGETRDALVDKAGRVARDLRDTVNEKARAMVHESTQPDPASAGHGAKRDVSPPIGSAR